MTEYVVLRAVDENVPDDERELWEAGLHVNARSASEAIRSGSAGKEGIYVAVPARSWKELKVKVENTVKVTIG